MLVQVRDELNEQHSHEQAEASKNILGANERQRKEKEQFIRLLKVPHTAHHHHYHHHLPTYLLIYLSIYLSTFLINIAFYRSIHSVTIIIFTTTSYDDHIENNDHRDDE